MSTYLQQFQDLTSPVTLIIKYRGDFAALPRELFFSAEDLGGGFAVVSAAGVNIPALINEPNIIYIEAAKPLEYMRLPADPQNGAYFCRPDTSLDGSGVIIGIIDSYIDISHPVFNKISYYGETPELPDPHGTNVAGIAAQTAPGAEIIGIGVSDGVSSTAIMLAAARLVGLAGGKPLVINISYGTNNGSHRGDSLFEEYLDYLAMTEQTAIVAAAGNNANVGRHFYAVSGGEAVNAEIYVTSGIFTADVWHDFSDEFSLQLTAPNGETYFTGSSGGRFYFHGSIAVFFEGATPYMSGARININFIDAEKGIWKFTLLPRSLATDGALNIWADGGYFIYPSRNITVTLPALARGVITAAAYDPQTGAPAIFSGVGPAANGLQKPDISAPGVNIYTAAPNGGYATVSGTSFSAPIVSGVCALLMQWGIVEGRDPFMYGKRLKAFLQKGARRLPDISYPDSEWGYGAVCLKETLKFAERRS